MKSLFGGSKKKKIFGIPLEQCVKTSPTNDGLPLPISRAIQRIEKKGMDLEGIYRISATRSNVEDLQKAYDSGKDPNLDTIDTFVISGMMKKYFVELPEPVMTFDLYERFLAAARNKNKKEKVMQMKKLVEQMPPVNKQVLFLVMSHLRRVADKANENKMGPNNLAIVFGPTLFRSRDESPIRVLQDSPALLQCVQQFLLFFEYIFNNGPESVLDALDPPVAATVATSETDQRWENIRKKRKPHREEPIREESTEASAENRKRGKSITGSKLEIEKLKQEFAEQTEQTESTQQPPVETNLIGESSVAPEKTLSQDTNIIDDEEDGEEPEKQQDEDKLATTIEDIGSKLGEVILEVTMDLDRPFESVNQRLVSARERDGRGEDFTNYTLVQLEEEKKLLKTELRNFERLFFKHKDREPTKEDKSPLVPLYHRYRDIKKKLEEHTGKAQDSDGESTQHHPATLLPAQLQTQQPTPQPSQPTTSSSFKDPQSKKNAACTIL